MKNGFYENRAHDCIRLAVKHRPDLYFEQKWLRCPGFFQNSASKLQGAGDKHAFLQTASFRGGLVKSTAA